MLGVQTQHSEIFTKKEPPNLLGTGASPGCKVKNMNVLEVLLLPLIFSPLLDTRQINFIGSTHIGSS